MEQFLGRLVMVSAEGQRYRNGGKVRARCKR